MGKRKLSAEDVNAIQSLARLLRKILEIHDRAAPNILQVLEQLKSVFPRLIVRVVPDTALEQPARAYPQRWTIRIRQSVYESLLRGRRMERWTLCHEFAHVIRSHPGKPFREPRGKKRHTWREREANIFATEFLIPRHLAAKYETADSIARIFQVSRESAEKVHFEREQDRVRAFSGIKSARQAAGATQKTLAYHCFVEDQASAVHFAITQTLNEAKTRSLPVEAFRNNPLSTAVVTAVGSRLLLDAYDSFHRSSGASKFKAEAALIAAIVYMLPIREIGEPKLLASDVLNMNKLCAEFAVRKLLGRKFGFHKTLPEPDDPNVFRSSYLDSLLDLALQQIQNSRTILAVPNLPNYATYNSNNDVHWGDIHYLEHLMNALEHES